MVRKRLLDRYPYGIDFPSTNESLEAIMTGLDVQEKDRILAIAGSGDQAFAMLERGAYVVAVDNDKDQIEFMEERVHFLRTRNYKEFLRTPPQKRGDKSKCIPLRNAYFKEGNRMQNIAENLDNLEIKECDIAHRDNLNLPLSKVYLSNFYPHSVLQISAIISALAVNGLVYHSYVPMIESFISMNALRGLVIVIDKELTYKARVLEKNQKNSIGYSWFPVVLQKIKYNQKTKESLVP